MGGCIGLPFCLALIAHAPERVTAALQNPTGLTETNRRLFAGRFEEAAACAEQAVWTRCLPPREPEVVRQTVERIREFLGASHTGLLPDERRRLDATRVVAHPL
jgi:hypothetical protein